MIINETIRPAEHLHSVRCLSTAIICAVENLRDTDDMTDLEFRLHAQDNDFLSIADDYLQTGTCTCYCGPCFCSDTCRTLASQD